MREHYKPARQSHPVADALLAVAIGLTAGGVMLSRPDLLTLINN